MNPNDIMNFYDEVDSDGLNTSLETKEIYSVLTAINDALDTDLPNALQRMVTDGNAHSLHAYIKNELLALRRIRRDYPDMQNNYKLLLESSLYGDLQAAQKKISEQLLKLQEL